MRRAARLHRGDRLPIPQLPAARVHELLDEALAAAGAPDPAAEAAALARLRAQLISLRREAAPRQAHQHSQQPPAPPALEERPLDAQPQPLR